MFFKINFKANTYQDQRPKLLYQLRGRNAFKLPGLPVAKAGDGSVVVYPLFIIAPIVLAVLCWILVLLFCTLCPFTFAIILLGKRELVPLL